MFGWRMEEEAKSEFTIAVNWHRTEGSIATTHPPRDGRARHLGEFEAETRERNIIWKIHALPVVQADQALLRLVLVNLISNAVKFTGGRTEAKIEIGCVPNGSAETVIFIRDNGRFDPNYTKKLFGVFQRLHNHDEFEGTGIGLANVQRIIRQHGGRIWTEGAVDVGATFYFSIPKTKRNGWGSRGVLGPPDPRRDHREARALQ